LFFAVPRVWEKFEERLKEAAAANKVPILKSLAEWAKRTATREVELVIANKRRGNQTSFSIASFVFL